MGILWLICVEKFAVPRGNVASTIEYILSSIYMILGEGGLSRCDGPVTSGEFPGTWTCSHFILYHSLNLRGKLHHILTYIYNVIHAWLLMEVSYS